MKPKYALALLLAIALSAAAGVALILAPADVVQPLAFDHQVHVEEVGAECVDCHLYALSGVRATIPNTRTCAGCHDEAMTESPVEARLIEYIDADEPIPWQKVYWVPDHVYFSHRRHTVAAEIACTVCHGEVGDRTEPLSRALVPISMDDCMHCHYEEGVSNDCILCHR